MNPVLGFGLVALSFVASVTFAKLHIDGGAYAATVLGVGVALLQAAAHNAASAQAETAKELLAASVKPPIPPPPPAPPRGE